MEAASGAGKSRRSRRVIEVVLNASRWARAWAVLRPKTPEPTIKIEEGMVSVVAILEELISLRFLELPEGVSVQEMK